MNLLKIPSTFVGLHISEKMSALICPNKVPIKRMKRQQSRNKSTSVGLANATYYPINDEMFGLDFEQRQAIIFII